mmetsp:Transcript_25599/g.31915  ORF Transcript_25599/g.31915 Transcript_25599/m.31915 type:complete len:223 (-) Transcript_25599:320-988(-)
MPSAWPSTGIRVQDLMCLTRELDPRGMHKSIKSSNFKSSATCARPSTKPITPAGTFPPDDSTTASVMIRCSTRFEFSASLPPFSNRPLPLRNAKEAIWGKLSGRDSKMMSSTPMGTVCCCSSRPSDTSSFDSTLPTGSSILAKPWIPSARVCNLSSVSFNRFSKGFSRLVSSACCKSTAFAAKISSWQAWELNFSATALSTLLLSSELSFSNARPPALAVSA